MALHSSGLQNHSKRLYRDEMSRLREQEQQLLRQENERLQAEVHSINGDLVQSREKVSWSSKPVRAVTFSLLVFLICEPFPFCRFFSSMLSSWPWSNTHIRISPSWWKPWSRRTPLWNRSLKHKESWPRYEPHTFLLTRESSFYDYYLFYYIFSVVSELWGWTKTHGDGEPSARKWGT